MLAGMAAVPALAVAGCPALATADPARISNDRTAWDAALTKMIAAKAKLTAEQAVYDPIAASWLAGRPDRDATIDWESLDPHIAPGTRDHVARVMDVDNAEAAFMAGEGTSWWVMDRDRDAYVARHRAAFDTVRAYRRQVADNDARHDWDAANHRYDALVEAFCDAEADLRLTPAPDMAALRHKLEDMLAPAVRAPNGECDGINGACADVLLADVRRLAGEGR
jgi:hypothetical protein